MRLLFLLALMCISMHLYGQTDSAHADNCTLTLKGKVIDGESKEPLEGASILIRELNLGCMTNERGECSLQLCPGAYKLEINHFGFKTLSKDFSLTENIYRVFVLHSDTCLLESVEIIAEEFISEETRPQVELKGKDLDRTRGSSLGEALKAIPGVSTLQTGPSIFKPVIQGMYGNRVLIMNNGVRQEGQQWGSEHAPEIDPFVASTLTVIKGAAAVQYGSDAIGGVILVDPSELRKNPGLGGELNLAGFSNNRQGVASAQLDYGFRRIKGLSLRAQGTYRRAGNSMTPDYYMKNTGFKEYNFSWAAGYQQKRFGAEIYYSQFNASLGIFSASHIGNLTDLQSAISASVPLEASDFSYDIERPFQEADHELVKIKSHYRFYKLGKLELTLARQFNYRAEYDKHLPLNNNFGDVPQVRFKITTHTANLILEHNSLGSAKGLVGINFIRQGNTTSGTARSFIPNFESYAGGAFLIERWKRKRWELEAGARYDYKYMRIYLFENNVLISPEYTFQNVTGTAGVVFTINEFWKARTNFSTAFRPVAANELFSNGLHHGSARLEYGDRNLKSEYAYSHSLTFNYQYKKIYGELNAYNNFIQNYIYLSPGLIYDAAQQSYVPEFSYTIRGAFPVFRYRQIDALFTGLDASFNDSISKNFIFSSKLSLLRAFNTIAKEHLILTPPASFEYGIRYRFHFSQTMMDPFLQVSNVWVSRKNKVPANQDVSPPPPGYTLFNLEAGFRIMAGRQPIDFTFSIYNLFDKRYRDYMDRFRYFTDAVGRNFVLRIKVPFDFNKKTKIKN